MKGSIRALVIMLMLFLLAGCSDEAMTNKPPTGKPIKVSLLFSQGGRGDLSYNDLAYTGFEQALQKWDKQISGKCIEPNTNKNYEFMLRTQGQNETDVVITIGGFEYVESIKKVATEFPKTKFVLIDAYIPNLTEKNNITCIGFYENEGSFLVGATAALKSKSDNIGFIGGMRCPEIEDFQAGFVAGAKYINPDIKVFSDYIGDTLEAFSNIEKAEQLALKQYEKGADIIFHASGASGFGIFSAAEKVKKQVIGVDTDQALVMPVEQRQFILTSMLKRVDIAVYDVISTCINDELKGGYKNYGLTENGVGYAVNQYNSSEMEAIQDTLERIKQEIISGKIIVPSKVLGRE